MDIRFLGNKFRDMLPRMASVVKIWMLHLGDQGRKAASSFLRAVFFALRGPRLRVSHFFSAVSPMPRTMKKLSEALPNLKQPFFSDMRMVDLLFLSFQELT